MDQRPGQVVLTSSSTLSHTRSLSPRPGWRHSTGQCGGDRRVR